MDINKALFTLEIDLTKGNLRNLTEEYIKKKYHKLALINHPDKNGNSTISTNKFQEINEAYYFLLKELHTINGSTNKSSNNSNTFTQSDPGFAQGSSETDFAQGSSETDFVSSSQSEETNSKYIYLLSLFISSIIEGPNTWNKETIKNIIKEIVTLGITQIACEKNVYLENIFSELDKDSSLEVYSFICKYKHILYISNETLEFVSSLIKKKYKNDRVFILNPSITDLLDSNIFKLFIDDELYLVPLWHNELYFDTKDLDNGDIIVLCNPELPENITIDEDNNIHVSLDLEGSKLLDIIKKDQGVCFVSLLIGSRDFSIPINKLYMKKEQIYKFLKQGIANVIENDMYNVSNKSDIIVKIQIV
jgi:hypothetical protein